MLTSQCHLWQEKGFQVTFASTTFNYVGSVMFHLLQQIYQPVFRFKPHSRSNLLHQNPFHQLSVELLN